VRGGSAEDGDLLGMEMKRLRYRLLILLTSSAGDVECYSVVSFKKAIMLFRCLLYESNLTFTDVC